MRSNFDILGYLASRSIPYALEGKNVSQGWAGTQCPFCNDKSNHLGINLQHLNFNCFRCGETGTILKYIAHIEPGGWPVARQVAGEFASRDFNKHQRPDIEPTANFKPPRNEDGLNKTASHYLRNRRNLPHRMLQTKYHIASFGPASVYKFRIYIPVFLNGRLVTFTTRSYLDSVEPKYLHFPKRKSLLFVKETLYNVDNAQGTAIIVEGPTDVWKMGDGAVATFGVIFTPKQVEMIRTRFKRVFIMFDADAYDQADKLADNLSGFNMEVNVIKLDQGDPGSMSYRDVKTLRREIFGR